MGKNKKLGKKQGVSKEERDAEFQFRVVSETVAELISAYEKGEKVDVVKVKQRLTRKYCAARAPRVSDIIEALPSSHRSSLLPLIHVKPIRTASGICVVAVMCKPHRCPHQIRCGAQCLYCPGGLDSDFEYSTQSYTGYEPTSMRAIRARYHPFVQMRARLQQFLRLGHTTDKVEVIIMGGTFLSLPLAYQRWFVRNIHDALSGSSSSSVAEAVRYGEQSTQKCIGITIETRPDFCLTQHLSPCLDYGATRLEIGVQTLYPDVLKLVNRGHDIETVVDCFQNARDHGFKVCAHMMPDLPTVGFERDMECFRELFEDPRFRPDGLKLYPALVIRGTGLYELWRTKMFRSYPFETLVEVTARILAMVPPWTRVFRVQRDIPMPLVTSGVDTGNLREVALKQMAARGWRTGDVRTREVGVQETHFSIRPECVELCRRDYVASEGWETFLSYEDPEQDILIGLLRLRRPSIKKTRKEICSGEISGYAAFLDDSYNEGSLDNGEMVTKHGTVSIVRELHVYGSVAPIHSASTGKFQHQGYGTLLMQEAERIAWNEHGSSKMAVIAGVGTRDYYRKLGYGTNVIMNNFSPFLEIDGPYMSKKRPLHYS